MDKSVSASTIIIILSVSIIVSCVNLGYAASQPNANSSSPVNGGAQINAHRITANEVAQLKSEIGIREAGKNYNQKVNGHGTGLAPPTAENWIDIAKKTEVIDSVSVINSPAVVDNSATPWFPPIGDQDGEGSCAAWATGYYVKTYQEAKEHNWDLSGATWEGGYGGSPSASYQNKIISPEFIYHLVNNGVDEGTSFEAPINLINNVGACMWQNMPYDPTHPWSWPTEAAWAEAPQYRGNSTFGCHYIFANNDAGISSVKSLLADGNLVLIALDAYQYVNLTSEDVMTADNYNSAILNHANTIVGYNESVTYMENGVLTSGAFKIANSWGVSSVHSVADWENIDDGFYWMSYACMKKLSSVENPCVFYQDLTGYQPQLLATFEINHNYRGDCEIIFGLGMPSMPTATKRFDNYVLGGNASFCANRIVFDITELKSNMLIPYNQPFFMRVFDKDLHAGNNDTGTVTYFGIGDASSSQVPRQTVNNANVTLTLLYSETPSLSVYPTQGNPASLLSLSGAYFWNNSYSLRYFDPSNASWITISNNTVPVLGSFIYLLTTPDLLQNNLPGDHPAQSDTIIYQAQDNSCGRLYNASFIQMRRGLSQVGNATATGLYGNNTDLSQTVFISSGQYLAVSGSWFPTGSASLLWDGANIANTTISLNGTLTANVTLPTMSAGIHTLVIRDVGCDFAVNLTKIPTISNNLTGGWHNSNFDINLTPDCSGVTVYYKVNNGPVCSISTDGQPQVTVESATNTLEYWGEYHGINLPTTTLTGIKLDKTAPTGTVTSSPTTTSTSVTLTLSATDALSGVSQMRFSNDGSTWSSWTPYATTKTWTLTDGNGQKTVYAQYMDAAGLTSQQTTCTITFSGSDQNTSPTPSPTTAQSTPTPTSAIPELNTSTLIVLLAISALMLTVIVRKLKK